MTINRSGAVAHIADSTGVDSRVVSRVLAGFEELLVSSARNGEPVQLTGIFTLTVAERSARTGRNPRTSEPLEIAATTVPRFAAGTTLRKAAKEGVR